MLRFRLQQPAAGPATVDAAPASEGRYVAATGLLGIVGAYDVDVVLRRRRVDDQTTKFTLQAALPVAPVASPPAPSVPAPAEANP